MPSSKAEHFFLTFRSPEGPLLLPLPATPSPLTLQASTQPRGLTKQMMWVASRGAWAGRPRVAGRALSQRGAAQTASRPYRPLPHPEGGLSSALPPLF